MMTTTLTRQLENVFKVEEIKPGLFSIPNFNDGVYGFFEECPMHIVFNQKSYSLTEVPGVSMSSRAMVADEALRICKINAPRHSFAEAVEAPVANVNDGIYQGRNGDRSPAYAVIDGKTYMMRVR